MKLLLISLFLIGTVSSCECVNSNTKKDFSTDDISSLKFDDKTSINNKKILNKLFYSLVEENNNNNNTQQNTQNAKSQQEIRSIVAQAISTPEQDINFVKIKPEYEDDYAMQNNGVPLYIYEVEARANGLEYDVVVDAVSGKVLKVEIDN